MSLAGVVDSVLTQDREYVGASSETKPTGLLEGKLSHHKGSQTRPSQILFSCKYIKMCNMYHISCNIHIHNIVVRFIENKYLTQDDIF